MSIVHRSTPAARTARLVLRVGAAAALVAAGTLGVARPGAASPTASGPTASGPTAAARAAGITSSGGGFMGWSRHATTPGPTSSTTSRPSLATASTASTAGIDVSSYQGSVNWSSYWSAGKRFAYTKATEGTTYTNPSFSQQYSGSYAVGMIRGAYHFARPNVSGGATQAAWFVSHGGGWSADGRTLPGALDIEYNPYGASCYGLGAASMVSWIRDFSTTYHSRTGRYPVIYSTTDWWSTCTGNSAAFASTSPLWVARYASTPGTLPRGWSYYTFWQYGTSPVDSDVFNGSTTQLRTLAVG